MMCGVSVVVFFVCVCWALLHENCAYVGYVMYCVTLHGLWLCVYGDCVLLLYIYMFVCLCDLYVIYRVMMYGLCLCRCVCVCVGVAL